MPILENLVLPASASLLEVSGRPLFLTFISSKDPITGQSWCPDVRAVLPSLNSVFAPEDAPDMKFVEVGQRPEWKAPNDIRAHWNVQNVPTLVKFESVNGEVKEVGRLEEEEIKDHKTLRGFLKQ